MATDTLSKPIDKHLQTLHLEVPKGVIERAVRAMADNNLHIEGIALVRGAYRHFDGSAASITEGIEIYSLLTGWRRGSKR